MPFAFSNRSRDRLRSCHPVLQELMSRAIQASALDFTILCGYRSQEEQDAAFAAGNSKLKWPQSKHNRSPSLAVDIAPYPVDWNDEARFISLAAEVKRTWASMPAATKQRYILSWGGDWETFRDLPHWELRPDLRTP